ncbi:ferredoxin [Actinomycetospora atypica]|uniref:Ferredoxin n=1 Tax=Actinomycetospora atypica TaxID=1290095 RepID=A0ABV9YRH0_9PSEU
MSTAGPVVVVHQEYCAGTGACRGAAPDIFGATDGGWVTVLDEHPAPDRLPAAIAAQEACPLAAIEVLDADGEALA